MSLKCRSLKNYLCLCFGCHLFVLKRKNDFRNWSLYPLSKPKWAELKRDFRLLLVALLWRLLSPPCGDSLRGLAGLQQLMKAPGESPQSLCCCSWHTWRWVREELLSKRKGGTCPAAHCQLLCPTFGQTAFQTEIIRQWVPAPWGSDAMETGLAWVGAGRGNRRGNGLQEDAPDSRSLQRHSCLQSHELRCLGGCISPSFFCFIITPHPHWFPGLGQTFSSYNFYFFFLTSQ